MSSIMHHISSIEFTVPYTYTHSKMRTLHPTKLFQVNNTIFISLLACVVWLWSSRRLRIDTGYIYMVL